MNKSELIDAVASSAGITKAASEKAVSAVFSSISGALAKGESTTLVGFGTFATAKRAARTGKKPKTSDTIKIATKTVTKFSAGKALKEAVNNTGTKKKK